MKIFRSALSLLCLTLVLGACVRTASPEPAQSSPDMEDRRFENAPLDLGIDIGNAALEPEADTNAHINGAWSAAANWPLMAIHAALLPNGSVITYGTNAQGDQGAYVYDIWNPEQGFVPAAHTTLDVTTGTDIFCSAQALIPGTNQMIITGGDVTIDGDRNYSSSDVNFLDITSYGISKSPVQLLKGRWYPTLTTLPNGEILMQGGRADKNPDDPVLLPEIYNPDTGWRGLINAESRAAYGPYYYPWSFVTPEGDVFFTNGSPKMWRLDPSGDGQLTSLGVRPDNLVRQAGSAVMYDEGKVLISGGANEQRIATDSTLLLDLSSDGVEVSNANPMAYARTEHDLTVLPNGEVLATGGSAVNNELVDVAYAAEMWNPDTQAWRTLAEAGKARLYHSTSLLLPDATVLTAGGGAPGPITQVNAEIYYPPYLFEQDGSGQLAPRPEIRFTRQPRYNRNFTVRLNRWSNISRVSLVRVGSVTHAWNMEQRFIDLDFVQRGGWLRVTAPERPELAPPGHYMLFVLDQNGVPSEAAMVNLPVVPPPVPGALKVDFSLKRSWRSGFIGNITLTNTGTTDIDGWALEFKPANAIRLRSVWGAGRGFSTNAEGIVSVRPNTWGGSRLRAGQSKTISYSARGQHGDPESCTINGEACQ